MYFRRKELSQMLKCWRLHIFVGARLSNVASLVAGLQRFVYKKFKATEYNLHRSDFKRF